VIALAASITAFGPLVSAQPGVYQWRTTTCNYYVNGKIDTQNLHCKAAFAYDTAVRQILFYGWGKWHTWNTFGANTKLGNTRECIRAYFDDGDTGTICTVLTPEQLKILGD